jgi:hypothetical protein
VHFASAMLLFGSPVFVSTVAARWRKGIVRRPMSATSSPPLVVAAVVVCDREHRVGCAVTAEGAAVMTGAPLDATR